MIEVEPASLRSKASEATSVEPTALARAVGQGGTVELTGEIVDSKCFLGVMVPGSGKTHKDCASLCLRGGIPPALYVQDRAGHSSLLLLAGPSGEPIGAQALQARRRSHRHDRIDSAARRLAGAANRSDHLASC